MNVVEPFARTLDQELMALLRGASLECLACGEFVMHARGGAVFCPECGSQLGASAEALADRSGRYSAHPGLAAPGDRGGSRKRPFEESPDTAGQDAGASQAAKADGKWHRKRNRHRRISGDAGGKGETVG